MTDSGASAHPSSSSRKAAPPLASPIDFGGHSTHIMDAHVSSGGFDDEELEQDEEEAAMAAAMQMDRAKRRERPPALDLLHNDHAHPHHEQLPLPRPRQQRVQTAPSSTLTISQDATPQPRPESTASSSALDSYYFSYPSPDPPAVQDEMLAPLPPPSVMIPKTPDLAPYHQHHQPQTPARDPGAIDRRGLIGVGELATPRWAQQSTQRRVWEGKGETLQEVEEAGIANGSAATVVIHDEPEQEIQSSSNPWIRSPEIQETEMKDAPQPPAKPEYSPNLQTSFASVGRSASNSKSSRAIRHKPSINSESGGEEILYKPPVPKKFPPPLPAKDEAIYEHQQQHWHTYTSNPQTQHHPLYSQQAPNGVQDLSTSVGTIPHPPSAFVPSAHRARKRTSDEFAMDQAGTIVPKSSNNIANGSEHDLIAGDDKHARRHRSLGVAAGPTKEQRERERERARERRRGDSIVALGLGSPTTAPTPAAVMSTSRSSTQPPRERHSRHMSASASSSQIEAAAQAAARRVHTMQNDLVQQHVPPSPSSASYQHLLRTDGTAPATPPLPTHHSSPSVGHALLRGNQEGWAGLDDSSTAEALRRLDGVGSSAKVKNRTSTRSGGGSSVGGSRPPTPGQKTASGNWEGHEASLAPASKKTRGSVGSKEQMARASSASLKLDAGDRSTASAVSELGDLVLSGGDDSTWATSQPAAPAAPPPHTSATHSHGGSHRKSLNGKDGVASAVAGGSARSSYGVVPKRGSASSASITGTPTSGSRDSTTLSSTTSNTSISLSQRHSYGKMRRNSAGSDISSVHSGDAASQRDRAAALASGSHDVEDSAAQRIPPVPPLPKDLANYRSPLPSSTGMSFSSPSAPVHPQTPSYHHEDPDRTINIPSIDIPPSPPKQQQSTTPAKAPSKKWSFSGLSLHLPGSSSSKEARHAASPTGASPRSSRSTSLAIQSQEKLDYSSIAEHGLYRHPDAASSKHSNEPWSPSMLSPDPAMDTYFAAHGIASPHMSAMSPEHRAGSQSMRTPEMRSAHSRTETSSSASTHTRSTAAAGSAPPPPSKTPLSPKRSSTTRRLTPSAIPFFRRSSSQSMQVSSSSQPKSSGESSSSPTRHMSTISHHASNSSVSTSGSGAESSVSTSSAVKKSSMLSLLKGSGSRKSLHMEKPPPELKVKEKKEEKDRSESRISVLMGRKRGKTLSATDPKKPKEAQPMPPMQITALSSSTTQRVANLKPSSTLMTPTKSAIARTQPSPASHLSKASDASLRSSRQHLPTIAGSPSVGPVGAPPPAANASSSGSLLNSSMREKDTPTKIPRIPGRTSTTSSPQSTYRGPSIMGSSRRMSLNNSSMSNVSSNNTEVPPSPGASVVSDFGLLDGQEFGVKAGTSAPTSGSTARARGSPQSMSRGPRQSGIPSSATTASKRALPRESLTYNGGLRKSSSNSVASLAAANPEAQSSSSSSNAATSSNTLSSRLSALSPSKPKLLSPKVVMPPPARVISQSVTAPALQSTGSPSSGRQSLSTPSPVQSMVDEDEILGDEEMMAYIKRTQARKLANGARKEDLDELLRFPEPLPPVPGSSANSILKSSQAAYLSDYERKEILDFPQVYCIGARSDKKPATRDNKTNNYGYDDERGDYLVVNHDHLAYRYEVIGTLGKGSFGQVLHCRDHATGLSVAIKIIRNKKRFHHQALVEIKILDNLRKWDAEEKHYVIKMTEHFYFRNHLCIAMELLSINLYELIKANGFVGFTTTLIRRFTTQMLASLALMRHHRIVHCDLKPENILLRHPAKSGIKVIDFGSSCFEHEKVYTYIQSRFYRSPEVILGMNYHMAIDMWSLGCILAELYTGFPIFPGENEQEQLSCIMEVLGVPDKDLITRSSRKNLFFDSTGAPRPVVNSKGRRRKPGTKTLAQVLRCDDEAFVDFIAKCLVWDPERRLKPAPAMRHPFVAASRKSKSGLNISSTTRSLLSSSSISTRTSKMVAPQDTPRKSLIGAPTPLTARVSSRAPTTTGIPSTPVTTPSNLPNTSASHRSYRTTQTNSVSYHHSPRSIAGPSSSYVSTKTS